MIALKRHYVVVGSLTLVLLLAGCGMGSAINEAVPDQRLAYKKQREAAVNLEVPPDLISGGFDDALDVPPAGAATYSEYAGSRAQRQQRAATGEVLPETPAVTFKRGGDERWLEVQSAPSPLWPRLIAFWREQGILLVEQDPAAGIMRTDWLDNRAEIRRDFLTRMISKVAAGLYATSTRDQYTLRVERGATAGVTAVFLTHRGMEETLVTNAIGDGNRTVWEPSGRDPDREAEMLQRLMVFLGASQQQTAAAAASGTRAAASGQGPEPASAGVRLIQESGVEVLLVPQESRRAWRLTGTALTNAGFAVEDRDQTQGLFYVRYAGPEVTRDGEKPGLLSRLAFWRKDEVDRVRQYRIRVSGNDRESRVSVLDESGQPERSENAGRILALLQAQMR